MTRTARGTRSRTWRPERWLSRHGGVVELLRAPALVFGAASGLRARLYDRGLLPTARLEVPVVSVGNLTAGGTGKTPMTVLLARELLARGRRPGLLSRGYGASRPSGAAALAANDEGRMLERLLPDVPQVQAADRVAGGRRLAAAGVDVVVLDDGFQHRRLARDLDLVLVDATRPWGLPAPSPSEPAVRALLPRGLLRERPEVLARAHAVVLTRCDQVEPARLDALATELHSIAPGPPILRALHRPARLVSSQGTASHPSALRGRDVRLVSAVGNPDAFEGTVTGLGARVVEHRRFPDHHVFGPADLDGLSGSEEDGELLLTTTKDAGKLGPDRPFHVLEVELSLLEGGGVLGALLDALPRGRGERERANLHEGLHG